MRSRTAEKLNLRCARDSGCRMAYCALGGMNTSNLPGRGTQYARNGILRLLRLTKNHGEKPGRGTFRPSEKLKRTDFPLMLFDTAGRLWVNK